ncbi:MAG TPA: response regulator [Acidimicrobiia bacterium]|nr:response regulator [Acidimicrobiia bacterium]
MTERILLIDDDPDIVRFVTMNLELEGYEVTSATSGREGLEAAASRPPDLVLLDVMMSDIDGLEVLSRLQASPATVHVAVILLTARAHAADRVRGLELGADDYVTKPFDIEELVARIGSVIRRSKAMRDLSPLTALPGNFRIAEEMQRRVAGGRPLAIVHADLDNFKAFNDHYGFMRGDNVIKFTANTLIEAAVEVDDPTCFVGHVGGDDFIAVMSPDIAEQFCKAVLERFDDGILDFYDPQDALRGYVEVIDRRGERHAFPIVAISLGVATNLRRVFTSEWEASAVASEMKEHAKTEPGSAYKVDRRTS